MSQIKAVVFDIGQVLIEWQPERFYDSIVGSTRRRELFAALDMHDMNEQIDLGYPFRKTVYDFAEKHPEFAIEIRLWHDRWADMASPEISGSVRLMRAIAAKGVATFVLSNIGVEAYEIATKRYAFLAEFDQVYLSGALKTTKPDPQIYAHLERGCGLDAGSLLFTDDRAENITTAAARGWKTHLFEGGDGWAKSLVDHGVLTTQEAGL